MYPLATTPWKASNDINYKDRNDKCFGYYALSHRDFAPNETTGMKYLLSLCFNNFPWKFNKLTEAKFHGCSSAQGIHHLYMSKCKISWEAQSQNGVIFYYEKLNTVTCNETLWKSSKKYQWKVFHRTRTVEIQIEALNIPIWQQRKWHEIQCYRHSHLNILNQIKALNSILKQASLHRGYVIQLSQCYKERIIPLGNHQYSPKSVWQCSQYRQHYSWPQEFFKLSHE